MSYWRNEARMLAYERRSAAMHEAGHLAVATRFKVRGHAYIYPNRGREPDEVSWLGQFVYHRSDLAKLSRRRIEMISVAGVISAEVWREKRNPDRLCDVWSILTAEDMSQSDWYFSGCEPGRPSRRLMANAERVVALFMEDAFWRETCKLARNLIGKAGPG